MKKVFTKDEINGMCKTPEEVDAYDSFKDKAKKELPLVDLLRDKSVEPKDKFYCLMVATTTDEQYKIIEYVESKGGVELFKSNKSPMLKKSGLEDLISFVESLES